MTDDYTGSGPSEPLSSHPVFGSWAAAAQWTAGTVAFGNVIEDLADNITAFAEQERADSWRRVERPAAIGCVPWLNNDRIIDALAFLDGGVCVVVDKGGRSTRALPSLRPLWSRCLPGFDYLAVRDATGRVPVVGPYTPPDAFDRDLGPIRVAGWRRRAAPLLHAKLLVLGDVQTWEDDDNLETWGMNYRFTPKLAWLGSANWTGPAGRHLEFGLWTRDQALIDCVFRFLLDVVRYSEPLITGSDQPRPELEPVEWDDAAMIEASIASEPYDDEDDDR